MFFTTSITWEAQHHVPTPLNAIVCHGYTAAAAKSFSHVRLCATQLNKAEWQ